MNFCLLGAPGVGKGTFSKLLTLRLRLHHISLGDLLRQQSKKCTPEGDMISQYLSSGELLPDEMANVEMKKAVERSRGSRGSRKEEQEEVTPVLQDSSRSAYERLLLDGYPRNLPQAKYLCEYVPDIWGVHIVLAKDVAVEKLLGRRLCSACGRSFNTADICRDGYIMPAILPGKVSSCPLGEEECKKKRHLETRSDDTRETILNRFDIYEKEIAPILDFYSQKGRLKTFHVKRGVDDIDDLISVMTKM